MKTFSLIILSLSLSVGGLRAQAVNDPLNQIDSTSVPPPTIPQVVNAGASHNIWQWWTYELVANGQVATHSHSYNELASGLNYQDPVKGQWVPSQALIEPYAQGAIAQKGQHQVLFANNLNSAGAIDEQTPDGKRLTSNILGLLYDDPITGQSVQIAQIQDAEGLLIADNQVLFTNVFDGVQADVLYTYRLDGMEQEVVLRAQLPAPEAFGLKSTTVELVVVTEFINPPEATVWDMGTDPQSLEPDEAVSWGATSLGRGQAFSLDGEEAPASVIKQYRNINGRYFLYEKVRFRDIQRALSSLPEQASNAHGLPGVVSRRPSIPKALTAKAAGRPIRLAHSPVGNKGYVLDYTSLNSAYTNFTFQGDTTYYLSGNLNLSGTNYFEGNTVIKYAANASITGVAGSVMRFLSAPYRPVVFTAKDDNTIAESISGSTGSPTGYYANPALTLASTGNTPLSAFRIAYANRGLSVSGASPIIYNAQLINCGTAVSDINGAVIMENVLFSNTKTNFNATSSANTISVQNATFNNVFELINGTFTSTSLYLTNCIFVNATNLSGNITAGYNGFYQSPEVGSPCVTNSFYPLQRAGAANCYLTSGGVFTNAGTIFVDTNDLDQLWVRTTHPPLIYSNTTISVPLTLSVQAGRDTSDNPDLGYHYDPLDYVFGAVIAQSNLTFTAGTAVGWFYNSGGGTWGLDMGDSATASFGGNVSAPCHWVKYNTVQEGGNGLWASQSFIGGLSGQSFVHAAPGLTAQFTTFSVPATEAGPYRDNGSTLLVLTVNNCEFYSCGSGAYHTSVNATNCLYVNGAPILFENHGTANLTMQGCTCFRGLVEGDNTSGGAWPVAIFNCAFDSTTFYLNSHSGPTNGYFTDYNSFLLNSNTTPFLGGHEIIVTNSYNWQTSWLGNYYLTNSSRLIDKGNKTANLLGLYQFTTQTNQIKETNSLVDIGYHYVATDGYGNPLDSNGDGVPDYIEDANGNGLFDLGEINWTAYNLGLQVIIARPRNGTTLP